MKTSSWVIGEVLAAGLVAGPAGALSPPETTGFSAERLSRITPTVQRSVDEGRVAGAVTLVSRGGRVVHFEATGRQDVERAGAERLPRGNWEQASPSGRIVRDLSRG